MPTQTQTFTLTQANQSLWNSNQSTVISGTIDNFVFNLDDLHLGAQPSAQVGSATLGVDVALNMTGTTFGIPINYDVSAGGFNLSYPLLVSLATPQTVLRGDNFSVATGLGGVQNALMNVVGPHIALDARLIFQTNISGHMGFEWAGVPGIDAGAVAFVGTTNDNGANYFDSSLPIAIEKDLLGLDFLQGGTVLNQASTLSHLVFSESALGGSKVFRNPWLSFNYDLLAPGKISGVSSATLDGNGLKDVTTLATTDDPWAEITFDLDDIAGSITSHIPGGAVLGEAISRLDAEYRIKREFLGVDLGSEYEGGLLSVNGTLGIKPAIKVAFDAQQIRVRLTSNTGETHSGVLGDTFTFSSPDGGVPARRDDHHPCRHAAHREHGGQGRRN